MAIAPGYAANLATIIRAAQDGNLALLECTSQATGEVVITLVAVGHDGQQYIMSPLAKMFDGDPYEELNPPSV